MGKRRRKNHPNQKRRKIIGKKGFNAKKKQAEWEKVYDEKENSATFFRNRTTAFYNRNFIQ
jgi:hypothetical protein